MSGLLAIDPGLNGALAYTDGTAISVRDMPIRIAHVAGHERKAIDEAGLARMLRSVRMHADLILIEDVHGMPSQSAAASFIFGYGAGVLHGVGEALGYRIEKVSPQRWQGAMGCRDKDHARALAAETWPAIADQFARKKDDGRAEAALIAKYGWQVFGKGPS